MEDEQVARVWEEERRKEQEASDHQDELELFPSIVYPIKGIMAPGRVLVPVHWNHLFDRGGHSVGIASRLGPRDPLGAGRLLDQFLDNENCHFDATFGTAFLSSLQKSCWSRERDAERADHGADISVTRVRARGGALSTIPRGLVGRIADGESNLHFLPVTLPTSATSPATASADAVNVLQNVLQNVAGMNMASNMFECDQTGCALISYDTGGERPKPSLTPKRKDSP